MTAENSRWQELMDASYDLWQKNREWSYEQFLASLDAKERQAVLLGNMNCQIQNGGVQQWVDNGYASSAEDLSVVLTLMGSPRAAEWAEKLEEFVEEFVNTKANKSDCDHWLGDTSYDDDDEYESSPHYVAAEKLNDFYYNQEFHAEFEKEVEDFLNR